MVLENRLKSMEGDFFGRNKMCIGDIIVFSFFCSCITNEHVNCPDLRDACATKLEDAENVLDKPLKRYRPRKRDRLEQIAHLEEVDE